MTDVRGIVTRARESSRGDVLLATALTIAGELEVLLGPGDGSRLVSALALALATLPLAWRRDLPLLPLAAIAGALLMQVPLDGFLVGQAATPLAALVVALYSAGRYVAGAKGLAGAVITIAVLVATRTAFDPAVERAGDAVLTLVAVPLPLLVGRWVRGQALLQRELEEKAQRLARERERDARHAAEEERMRIAADLQAAVSAGLSTIVRQAQELGRRLAAEDHAAARGLLASIAVNAREALADVRRVLGVLRHDGQPPRLAPPAAQGSVAPAPPLARVEPGVGPQAAAGAAAGNGPGGDGGSVPRRRWWSPPLAGRGAPWLDRTLVAVLLVAAEIEIAVVAPGDARPFAALSAAAVVAPLLWRRRRPVTVAAAVLGAVSIQSAALGLDSFPAFDIAALICAAYAIGAYAERRAAIAGLVLFALGAAAHAAVFHPEGVVAALLGGAAGPWIAGRTVRSRRQLTGELLQKAARIQHARAQDAQAAMMAERARVARELHDVVAHNISVIAIQAAGADAVLERDRERAAQCAALIDGVAREALAELRRLVGAPSGATADATAPQPSLARLDGLARRARDGGLPVALRVEGEPAALPAGVELAAYRIVQEALANTAKHAGDARAWVVVRYGERAVEVEVCDDGRGPSAGEPAAAGGRHGLVGMRERVALYGGTLATGRRPDGGFMVRAQLPIGGA